MEVLVCGIGAILDPTGVTSHAAAERMLAALRHRGPDGEALVRADPVTLAFTRLAIIDVEGGSQPFVAEDRGCFAVVNGEIYNHEALRRDLERSGHRFATRSDCEVLLHAYEQHGPGSVARLNGIFASVVWDPSAQRLFAARDHFGVKPLYWWGDGRRVAFASEIRALLATGLVRPALDRVALDHFLDLGFVPSPRTLFAGVRKLAPATTIQVDAAGIREECFREPPEEPYDASPAELEEELRGRFLDAVDRQMMSEVPFGAFLSGGVDSAAVVAAMRERSGCPPRTFTVGFHGPAARSVDERAGAARTAAALGTDHQETAMQDEEYSTERRQYVWDLEEPCSRPSSPALRRLSRFASESVKVVLAGQGADECFGGYQAHHWAATLWPLRHLPASTGRVIKVGARARLWRATWTDGAVRMVKASSDVDWLLNANEWASEPLRRELHGDGELAEQGAVERRERVAAIASDVGSKSLLDRALYLDTHMMLPDRLLVPGDKLSMAAGLEQRVPFLDLELMRFVQRVPGHLRTSLRDRKRLLRRATEPLLPAEIRTRRKQPFLAPYADGFRGALGHELERHYAADCGLAEVIAPPVVQRMVAQHRAGRKDHRLLLLRLLELADWHRSFIER